LLQENVGNRRHIGETVAVSGQAGVALFRALEYSYDDQYRLTSESWLPTEGVVGESRTYTFDLAGNRLKLTHTKGESTSITDYAYDDLNRLLSVTKDGVLTSYGYDIDGNRQTSTSG
jgi:YD repeat-containing protein